MFELLVIIVVVFFFSSICGVTIWVLNLLSVQYAELFFIYYYVGGWCVTNSLLL